VQKNENVFLRTNQSVQMTIRWRFPDRNDTVKMLSTDRFVSIPLDGVGDGWEGWPIKQFGEWRR
jgi:hypothetical protein